MTALVFNTSPLSHFARAGRLAVLDRLTAASRCVVPQAVLDELRAGEPVHPPLADVRNAGWLEVVACDGLGELRAFAHYVRVLGAGERDIGEASVLAWAEVNGGLAVLDERAGTQAARARGVAVHGTLWLIANGLNAGELLLPEAERLVDQYGVPTRDCHAAAPSSSSGQRHKGCSRCKSVCREKRASTSERIGAAPGHQTGERHSPITLPMMVISLFSIGS